MLTTERKQLVVYVISRDNSKTASGFVVSPGRVLTAGHTFVGLGRKPDIKICLCDLESEKQIPAEVVWNGLDKKGKGYDAAILKFDPDTLEPASQALCRKQTRGLVSARPPVSGEIWECYGLPEAGDRMDPKTNRTQPRPIHWQGPANSANPGHDIDLTSWNGPDKASGWRGASGAAVFIGGRLCAIVIRAREQMKRMLIAQWLEPLLGVPEFVEKAGLEREDPLQALLDQAAKLLRESPRLGEHIAAVLQIASREPEDLARALAKLTIVQFLTHANRLHEWVLSETTRPAKDQRNLAKALEDVVDTLLPSALVASAAILPNGARAAQSVAILVLPCATMTVAEICLANLGLRKMEYAYESLGKAQPYGIRCLHPFRKMAVGFDEGDHAPLLTIFQDLVRELDVPAPFIPDGQLTPAAAKPVDDVLDRRSNPATRTSALGDYYFLFQDPSQQKLADDLHRLLPHLRVCQLAKDQAMPGEAPVCDLLKEYLRRKQQRENHRK